MTLILQEDYHALPIVEQNRLRWIPPERAERQDIRPLRIGILNIINITIEIDIFAFRVITITAYSTVVISVIISIALTHHHHTSSSVIVIIVRIVV